MYIYKKISGHFNSIFSAMGYKVTMVEYDKYKFGNSLDRKPVIK